MKVTVALDAMGGDNAPRMPVMGAHLARNETGLEILLVGDQACIRKHLAETSSPQNVRVVHCGGSVGMHEKVSRTLLRDRENSMRQVLALHGAGKADFALSAGNTAAFVSMAISELGLIPGIERPAIAVLFPTTEGTFSVLLDVGANTSTRPSHMTQYGWMGAAYARTVFGIQQPRVALLNIGEEPAKGDDLRRETFKRMEQFGSLHGTVIFTGNLEGQSLFLGKADVILCDGFTGNVVLKVAEGISRSFKSMLKRELGRDLMGKVGSLLIRRALREFARRADYADYGGGILLGVNGNVIISHGRSSARAILSAIRLGRKAVEADLLGTLRRTAEGV